MVQFDETGEHVSVSALPHDEERNHLTDVKGDWAHPFLAGPYPSTRSAVLFRNGPLWRNWKTSWLDWLIDCRSLYHNQIGGVLPEWYNMTSLQTMWVLCFRDTSTAPVIFLWDLKRLDCTHRLVSGVYQAIKSTEHFQIGPIWWIWPQCEYFSVLLHKREELEAQNGLIFWWKVVAWQPDFWDSSTMVQSGETPKHVSTISPFKQSKGSLMGSWDHND